MKKKYFGTDGIRGRVGQPPISADWILKLGWAVGHVLTQRHRDRCKVLIGKDTRISGYLFESALEAGLCSAGVDILLLGPMPTPGIAYLTHALRVDIGIVISASHNPYYDNGIKFFSAEGTKLPDEMEWAIEAALDLPLKTVDSKDLGKVQRVRDAEGRYVEFCKNTFSDSLDLRGLKLVVDCANGATYKIAPTVFRELGAEVVEMATDPDGFNINEDCGSTAPGLLAQKVLEEKADIGIALDGDGDRVIMIDHTGALVDGDELLFIIAKGYLKTQRLKGGVVGTIMSNYGLEEAFKRLEIPFIRTAVGDRYIVEMLKRQGWNLGGEASGHLLCLDANGTGDGIVSALQILSVIRDTGLTLNALKEGMVKFPQVLINVAVGPKPCLDHPAIEKAIAAAEEKLQGRGRVLLRPSGTESLIRVMVEGQEASLVAAIAEELAAVVRITLQV